MSEQINIDELEQVAAQAAGPQLGGANFTMAELKFRATFDPMTVLTLISQLRAVGDRAMHLERRLSDANGEVLRLQGADQHAQRLQAGHDEAVLKIDEARQRATDAEQLATARGHTIQSLQRELSEAKVERDELAAKLAELEGQEPVAWVDVKDSYEGPYSFEGMKLLAIGKHHLFARPVPADPVNAQLLDIATGKLSHLYAGLCPDSSSGSRSRDPECPACRAIAAAEAQQAEPACLTCGGRGEVGGWRHGEGYDQEPCPDCTKQVEPVRLTEEELRNALQVPANKIVLNICRRVEAAVLRKQGVLNSLDDNRRALLQIREGYQADQVARRALMGGKQ